MDPLDKAILASLYVSALEPQISSFDRINYKLPIGREFYRLKLQQLSELGFLEKNDDYKLSFFGRDALTVVLVGGVFDIIHPGHIHTLKAAKAQGDVLVVVIARTSTALKIKKDRRIYHHERLRKDLVSSLNLVDLAIIGKEGTLYDTVAYVKPDIIALGYDQAHSEKEIQKNCLERGIKLDVIRLSSPIPEIK